MIRVWHLDVSKATAALLALEADRPRLSDTEIARASAFSDLEASRAWMAAHIALRLALEHAAGPFDGRPAFEVSPRGRPSLPGVSFSLSHAAGHCLIAIGPEGRPLGIDLEAARTIRMTADRQAAIEAGGAALSTRPLPTEHPSRFLQAWVRLEALAKAEGDGLSRVLSRSGAYGARRGAGISPDLLVPHVAVHDLPFGPGLFGAIAMGRAGDEGEVALPHVPGVEAMPVDVAGLRALAAA